MEQQSLPHEFTNEEISNLTPEISARFSNWMKRGPYVVLRTAGHGPFLLALQALYSESQRFFSINQHEKDLFRALDAVGDHPEVGYHQSSGVKESFMIQVPKDDDSVNWPSPAFKAALQRYGEVMAVLGRLVVRALATHHQVPLNVVEPLFDLPQAQLTSPYAASVVRCYNYLPQTSVPPCEFHQDLSLLTMVPVTSTPGLEIYRLASPAGWTSVEADAKVNDIVVFPGETLSVVSKFFYNAATHRVTANSDQKHRYSLPFLLKARLDAPFAPWPNTGRDGDVEQHVFQFKTIREFINAEKAKRRSVNNLY